MSGTTFQELTRAQRLIISQVAQADEYGWSNQTAMNDIMKAYREFQEKAKTFDILSLTKDELIALGFGLWDSDLLLIPLWFFPAIPNGTKLHSIMGNEAIVGQDYFDTDTRGGCIAWGIRLEEKNNGKNL